MDLFGIFQAFSCKISLQLPWGAAGAPCSLAGGTRGVPIPKGIPQPSLQELCQNLKGRLEKVYAYETHLPYQDRIIETKKQRDRAEKRQITKPSSTEGRESFLIP